MGLPTAILAARAFIKSADTMPNGPKFFLLALLIVAPSSCYMVGKALDKAPAILREAPPAIRAMREQPAKPLAVIQPDSAKGQANR
jgi:hypothetical protein